MPNALADSDDDDYMSSKYLEAAAPITTSGPLSYAELRKAARRKGEDSVIRNNAAKRPRHEIEVEAREAALSRSLFDGHLASGSATPETESVTPAPAQNKALGMMMKMGFKPGQALGAAAPSTPAGGNGSSAPDPRIEPIKVEMRDRRTGIGVESAAEKRRRLNPKTAADVSRVGPPPETTAEFATRARQQYATQHAEALLRSARRTCEELDRRKGIETSVMWLDPDEVEARRWRRIRARRMGEPVSDDEGDELEDPTDRRPGRGAEMVELDDETQRVRTMRDQWLALDPHARLAQTLDHLRTEHFYCVHCGCQYDDAAQLDELCPGMDEDDH